MVLAHVTARSTGKLLAAELGKRLSEKRAQRAYLELGALVSELQRPEAAHLSGGHFVAIINEFVWNCWEEVQAVYDTKIWMMLSVCTVC